VLDDSAFLANIDVDTVDMQSANKHRLPKNRERYSINFEYDVADTTDSLVDTPVLISPLSDSHDVPRAQQQCPDFSDMINYLTSGSLPDRTPMHVVSSQKANTTRFQMEHFSIYTDHAPKGKAG